jgi:hypothetical protein
MASMSFRQVGRLFVLAHRAGAPANDEWQRYVEAVAAHQNIEDMRTLVMTQGGNPSSLQRGRLNEAMRGRPSPAAVLSTAASIRMAVTALSWFNPMIRSFKPNDMTSAFDYLQLSDYERVAATKAVTELQQHLAGEPTAGEISQSVD